MIFLHFAQTIRVESVEPLRRITRDFHRSPFSMLIHIILARTPLLDRGQHGDKGWGGGFYFKTRVWNFDSTSQWTKVL